MPVFGFPKYAMNEGGFAMRGHRKRLQCYRPPELGERMINLIGNHGISQPVVEIDGHGVVEGEVDKVPVQHGVLHPLEELQTVDGWRVRRD